MWRHKPNLVGLTVIPALSAVPPVPIWCLWQLSQGLLSPLHFLHPLPLRTLRLPVSRVLPGARVVHCMWRGKETPRETVCGRTGVPRPDRAGAGLRREQARTGAVVQERRIQGVLAWEVEVPHIPFFTILFMAYCCVISFRVFLKVANYILSKIYNKRKVTKAHLRFSLSAQKYMERLKSSVNSRYRKAIERGQSTIGSPNSFGKPVIRTRSSSPVFSRLNY